MKKLFTLFAIFALVFTACEQPLDEKEEEKPVESNKTRLSINNQSDINIIKVHYASVDFDTIGKGEVITKEVEPGTKYIYFSFKINNEVTDCRTEVWSCEEGKTSVFNLTNFTAVTSNDRVNPLRNLYNALSSFPDNLRIDDETDNSISIKWNDVSGTNGYNIYRSTSQNGIYTKLNANPLTESIYIDTAVSPSIVYWYTVTSIMNEMETVRANAISATTLLPAVNGILISSSTDTTISLAWNAVIGAASYNIYRAATINGAYIKVNSSTVTGTNYTDTGLTSSTNYYYRVCAVSGGIEGAKSDPSITGKTMAAPPTGVNASALSASSINISWNPVSSASTYKIYYEQGTSTNKILLEQVTGTSYTHAGLLSNTSYHYYIIATNSEGDSAYSTAASATTLPAAPAGISATALSTSSISISWNPVSGATYRVYYAIGSSTGTKMLASSTVNGTTYTHNGLLDNTVYYYFITAVINGRESEHSVYALGQTLPKTPQIVIKQGSSTINPNGQYNYNTVLINNSIDVTFTISNTGDANLTFTTVNNNRINLADNSGNHFIVIAQPTNTASIAPGGSTTFIIRFNPKIVGANLSATVQIKSNSRNNEDFSFRIFGNGRTYQIADIGPGGGFIFSAQGGIFKECSADIGYMNWNAAMTAVQNYKGGGFSDWRLPDQNELWDVGDIHYVYKLGNYYDDWYWSSDNNGNYAAALDFDSWDYDMFLKTSSSGVIAVRVFTLN